MNLKQHFASSHVSPYDTMNLKQHFACIPIPNYTVTLHVELSKKPQIAKPRLFGPLVSPIIPGPLLTEFFPVPAPLYLFYRWSMLRSNSWPLSLSLLNKKKN